MSLDLSKTINYYDWCRQRITQQQKWLNVPYLQKFNEALYRAKNNYDGEIVYYHNTANNPRYMSYGEGTPAFYLFKLVPRDYLIRDFNHNNYWRRVDPDSSIVSYLQNLNLNKYAQNSLEVNFPFSYVLFLLQKIRLSLPLITEVASWALRTKNNVVFKAHPMETGLDLLPINKYVHLVTDANTDYLVKNSRAVWSCESGVGFYALLHNKPTSYFENTEDYTYGPIAKFSVTPEDAASNQHLDYSEIVRYFTWYYNKIAIDVSRDDFELKLNNRLHRYFNLKESDYELLTDY